MTIERRGDPLTAVGFGNSSGNPREMLPGFMEGRKLDTGPVGRKLSEPVKNERKNSEQKLISEVLEAGLMHKSGLEDEDAEMVRRSAKVLDGMEDLDDQSKLRLFFFGAWQYDPNILYQAASIMGVTRLRVDDLIAEALRDKRYKYQIIRFNYLRKPNALEVRDLRRKGMKNPAAARELEIPLEEEKVIAQDLLLLEEIEPRPQGMKQAQRFQELCDSVEHYDGVDLTIDELAILLDETPRMVRYARKRLIAVGRIEKKSRADVIKKIFPKAEGTKRKVEVLRLHTKLSVKQIGVALDVPPTTIQHHATDLVRRKRIPRRGKGNPRRKIRRSERLPT